jgi:hypothetical protein
MGNGEKTLVEFIGVVNLPLASGGVLVLDDVVYVPSLRRSLISVSKLDSSGFGFHFGNKRFVLYYGSREIASGALCDGLYKLDALQEKRLIATKFFVAITFILL